MIKTEYKKGGRPTKGAAEKKKYRITVKLNTQDYYTLKGKAKSAGISMSEFVRKLFCVVMFGLINVNILYYSFSTLYQMCNLRQSL